MFNLAQVLALSEQITKAAAVATAVQNVAASASTLTGPQKLAAAVQGLQVLAPELSGTVGTVVAAAGAAETIAQTGFAIAKSLGILGASASAPAPAPVAPQVIALPVIEPHPVSVLGG